MEGLVVRAVLFSVAVRVAFLLLFLLMAFVSMSLMHRSGRFAEGCLIAGTFLLPVLVPAVVFIRTRREALGGSGAPTAFAMLAASLALLVTVVPLPGSPLAHVYVRPGMEQGNVYAGFDIDRLMNGPLEGLSSRFNQCQHSSDCPGEARGVRCVSTGFWNVCVATTEAGPSGCPPGWSCVETSPNLSRQASSPECVPADGASRFEAASACKVKVKWPEAPRPVRDYSGE